MKKTKKVFLCFLIIICIFIFSSKVSPINIEFKEVQKISISCSNNEITTEKTYAIWIISQFLKINPFFESDINQLQSSPENFITLWLKDGTSIDISSVGIYSLVTHQMKTEDGIEMLNGKVYITSFFMTNLIYYLTQMVT